jgi:hypothetical protein
LESRFVEAEDYLVLVTSDHELKEASQSCDIEVIDPEMQNEA